LKKTNTVPLFISFLHVVILTCYDILTSCWYYML